MMNPLPKFAEGASVMHTNTRRRGVIRHWQYDHDGGISYLIEYKSGEEVWEYEEDLDIVQE